MKPGLFEQQLSLMEELKSVTFSAHARLQTASIESNHGNARGARIGGEA
jgi:hypothetical protein